MEPSGPGMPDRAVREMPAMVMALSAATSARATASRRRISSS